MIAFVNHTLGFFLAPWEDTEFYYFHKRREPNAALNTFRNAVAQVDKIYLSVCFHIDAHGVFSLKMRNPNLIFAGNLREFPQYFLDLAWEYVYALDFHHVVCPSHDGVQTGIRTAARTGARNDPG